jgi:hypothetical protein
MMPNFLQLARRNKRMLKPRPVRRIGGCPLFIGDCLREDGMNSTSETVRGFGFRDP